MTTTEPALIYLDVGHRGKPQRLGDRGVVHGDLVEADLATRYALAADAELRRLGHDVVIGGVGRYEDRWAQADALGAIVYAQLHVNAGGGDRGEVFYDYRSIRRGAALAARVALALDAAVPWSVWTRRCKPDDDGEVRDEDYQEAFGCIAGVKAVARLWEPYFIDGPRVDDFVERLDVVGVALAQGIACWLAQP